MAESRRPWPAARGTTHATGGERCSGAVKQAGTKRSRKGRFRGRAYFGLEGGGLRYSGKLIEVKRQNLVRAAPDRTGAARWACLLLDEGASIP